MPSEISEYIIEQFRSRRVLLWLCQRHELKSGQKRHGLDEDEATDLVIHESGGHPYPDYNGFRGGLELERELELKLELKLELAHK